MKKHKRLLTFLMALLVAVTFAACSKDPEPAEPSQEETTEATGESGYKFINTLGEDTSGRFPKYVDLVNEYRAINSDTIGWLEVPGTHIDDVVVCYTAPGDNNNYYYRRNFDKEYSFNGIFYADFRSDFGDGNAAQLPSNTVIYGHTMSADWDGVMFAPLKYFTEEEFAKEHPYIHFSTVKEDLVFEVFAVFYATVNLPYNIPNLPANEHADVINECIKRSLYTYDTQVSADDKILTLSTCTYSLPEKGPVSYPNDYRYVVMAKLVDKREATKTEATFTVNPSPKEP